MCPGCDGVLLKKLHPLVELPEEALVQSPIAESLFSDHPEVDRNPPVGCPICGQTMRRYVYCEDSGVIVDSCDLGHGIWLDDGELAQIYDYLHRVEALDPRIAGLSTADKVTAIIRGHPRGPH